MDMQLSNKNEYKFKYLADMSVIYRNGKKVKICWKFCFEWSELVVVSNSDLKEERKTMILFEIENHLKHRTVPIQLNSILVSTTFICHIYALPFGSMWPTFVNW